MRNNDVDSIEEHSAKNSAIGFEKRAIWEKTLANLGT
jgi:hypothetical protein